MIPESELQPFGCVVFQKRPHMKQPHKSWDCSAGGNGCIGRVRHEEGLELFIEIKILCSWA